MITAVIRTDEHISDDPPESRTDDYLETCLDKLRQIGEIAQDVDADLVIDNGDTFHHKSSRENSHLMVSKVIDVHNEHYPCPVYQNPGNHDFPYTNIDYVKRQPLQVLFSSGTFKRLDDVTIEKDGLEVRFVGYPYQNDYSESDLNPRRGDEDHLVACGHCFASETGGDMFGSEPILAYDDLKDNAPDGFVFGHWHKDQGVKWRHGTYFINLGSMTRGALTEDNLDRIPKVAVLRIDETGEADIETRQLEVKPADDIFDLEKHRELEQEKQDMEDFLETLSAQTDTESTADIQNFIEDLEGFEHEIKDRSVDYLRQTREES